MRWLRVLLLVEGATFAVAAMIHLGNLVEGYRHQAAATGESVIAVALLGGLSLTWAPAPWQRRTFIASQAFAILGVSIGLATIAIGVGPQTLPDIGYHVSILIVLIAGLAAALQMAPAAER
jgi:hypothetical protein